MTPGYSLKRGTTTDAYMVCVYPPLPVLLYRVPLPKSQPSALGRPYELR